MIFPDKIRTRNNQKRSEEKKRIVLLWIAQFDFSTIELLSALLRQTRDATNLFFRRLIADGYLVPFISFNVPRNDLVRIGFEGVAYLKDNFGIDVRRKMRSDEIARRKKLFHDYCLQMYIAETFMYGSSYSVLTEKNISRENGKAHRIPDALVFDCPNEHTAWNVSTPIEIPEEVKDLRRGADLYDPDGFWHNIDAPIAIEIEVTPKSRDQAWAIFRNLLWQIHSGKLSQVHFVFAEARICRSYKVWFEELQLNHGVKLPLISPYRDCFKFILSDFQFRWLLIEEVFEDPRDWDLSQP